MTAIPAIPRVFVPKWITLGMPFHKKTVAFSAIWSVCKGHDLVHSLLKSFFVSLRQGALNFPVYRRKVGADFEEEIWVC
jgi:hypothetical protein